MSALSFMVVALISGISYLANSGISYLANSGLSYCPRLVKITESTVSVVIKSVIGKAPLKNDISRAINHLPVDLIFWESGREIIASPYSDSRIQYAPIFNGSCRKASRYAIIDTPLQFPTIPFGDRAGEYFWIPCPVKCRSLSCVLYKGGKCYIVFSSPGEIVDKRDVYVSFCGTQPCPLTRGQDFLIVSQRAISKGSQNPSTDGQDPRAVSQMLFVRYLSKFLAYLASILAIGALALAAVLSVYIPVRWGPLGFFPVLGIWWGTIIAAYHVARWGFG